MVHWAQNTNELTNLINSRNAPSDTLNCHYFRHRRIIMAAVELAIQHLIVLALYFQHHLIYESYFIFEMFCWLLSTLLFWNAGLKVLDNTM